MHVEIGIAVVKLIVNNVQQRCGFGEFLLEKLHHWCQYVRLVVRDYDNNHQLAGRRVADHHITQVSSMIADIVKRDVVSYGIVAQSGADTV